MELKITVTVTNDPEQDTEEMTIDLDKLRKVANPRQALVTHFLVLARTAIAEIDSTINI